MTFTFLNIPDPGDILSNSQSQLKNNFQYLQGSLGKDHKIVFGEDNTTSFEGRHNQVSLFNRNDSNLALPLDDTNGLLYASNGNLFWRGLASTSAIQLTGINPVSAAAGVTFLPGGLLMQWGTTTSSGAGTASVTFTQAFGSAPYSVQATVFQNTTNRHFVYVKTKTAGGFTTTNLDSGGSGEANTFTWLAIGPS